MTEAKFTIGDPVWSKMKGYCPWPSRIAAPHETNLENKNAGKQAADKAPKTYYLVYFFGSNNFAWMPEETIKPYNEFKDKNKNGSKNSQFKQGLKQIEEYIANGGKATLAESASGAAIKNDPNNDNAASPSGAEDSLSNDASNIDGELPTIDEELSTIKNNKPVSTKRSKNSHDSHNDSSSLTSPAPSSVQRDYSRTPFKQRKATRSEEASSTEVTSPTKRVKTSDEDSHGTSSLSSPTISTAITSSRPPASKTGARNVLLRASHYTDAPITETPQINMNSLNARSRNIRPSTLKFGFIGLGFLGQRLLKNLLTTKHHVTIWNRTNSKCKEFVEAGAINVTTAEDVVANSDIVFSCLSSPLASKEVIFGKFGVLGAMDSGKALVEMSSIDVDTTTDISEAVVARGGRYLAAPPIVNGKKAADDAELTIVASGDRSLYEDCSSCFQAMGKQSFYLGHGPEHAIRMHLILSSLYGTIVGSVAECIAMVDRCELQSKDFLDILKLSIMSSPLAELMAEKMITNDCSIHMPLEHLQKDLRLALSLAETAQQSCPLTAITNEVFKNSMRAYSDHDASLVIRSYKFT